MYVCMYPALQIYTFIEFTYSPFTGTHELNSSVMIEHCNGGITEVMGSNPVEPN